MTGIQRTRNPNKNTATDIRREGWVVALLPRPLRPYYFLARLDRPIGTWLLLLPSLWGIVLAAGDAARLGPREIRLIALFTLGAVVMRAAGCVINDLWDRDLDARVTRTQGRPLASGEVTPRRALIFLALLLGIGLMILLQLFVTVILLGFIAMCLVAVYPLMKRITWWPQAFLGLTFNFGALMGWAAVTGTLAPPALILYAAGFFWTLGYDTIYAHQDREDDLAVGIKSSALRLGRASWPFVAAVMLVFWALVVTAGRLAGKGDTFTLLMLAPLAHLIWQLIRWTPGDPANCLSRFRAARNTGLLILAAIAMPDLLSGIF